MASGILSAETKAAPFTEAQRRCLKTHLGQVLASSPFATSRRSQAFLRYVVEETLAGRGHAIKERNIAVDVFSKPSTFDTQNESIVRVNANELRKRLATAYEGDLAGSDIRIELPIGTYQPVFHKPCSAARTIETAVPDRRRFVALYLLSGTLVCLAITAAVIAYSRERRLALDLLWDSFVSRGSVVLIALPAPTVLELSQHDKWLPLQPGISIPTSDLRAKETYYVGTGAALGAARFGEKLGMRHQPFALKFGNEVTFPDLGQSPAILLGGYSSAWGIEMTQTLRFRMERDAGSNVIVDTFEPRRVWRAARPIGSSLEAREGYALVTRLMISESGHPLLIAAGMSARDTEAAAKFLSDPAYFDLFAKRTGNWSRRNFQVVLHDYVHGHSPGAPIVLAWYVW